MNVCIIVVGFILRNTRRHHKVIIPFRLCSMTFRSNNSFFSSRLGSRWELILLITYTRSNIIIILILMADLRLILTFIIKIFLIGSTLMDKFILFIVIISVGILLLLICLTCYRISLLICTKVIVWGIR